MQPNRSASRHHQVSGIAPANKRERERAELKVERLVEELCSVPRDHTLRFTVRVGELITKQLFEGDVHALRALGSRDPLFRQLAAHPRLPFSHAALWRAIGIYELVRRFPALAHAEHLGVTHLRAVLGLPEGAQADLLKLAERERWTGQKLETVAAGHRAASDKRSRSNTTVLMRTLRRLEQAADDARTVVDARIVDHISTESARSADERLRSARHRISALEDVLRARLRPGAQKAG